jgi:hypothetical protein
MSLALLMAGLQIGGGLASKLLEEDNPKLAKNIQTLIGSFSAGAQGMSSLAGAFGSPNITQTPSPTSDSVSDFIKSLTIETPGGGAVDQGLNRNIAQGLFGNTRNKTTSTLPSIFNHTDFIS